MLITVKVTQEHIDAATAATISISAATTLDSNWRYLDYCCNCGLAMAFKDVLKENTPFTLGNHYLVVIMKGEEVQYPLPLKASIFTFTFDGQPNHAKPMDFTIDLPEEILR